MAVLMIKNVCLQWHTIESSGHSDNFAHVARVQYLILIIRILRSQFNFLGIHTTSNRIESWVERTVKINAASKWQLARLTDSPIQMTPDGDTERQIAKATLFLQQKIGAEKHGQYEMEPAHLPGPRFNSIWVSDRNPHPTGGLKLLYL